MRNQRGARKKKKNGMKIVLNLLLILAVLALLFVVATQTIFKIFNGKYNKDNVMVTQEVKLNIKNENLKKFDFELIIDDEKLKGTAQKTTPNKAKYEVSKDVNINFERDFKGIDVDFKGTYSEIGLKPTVNIEGKYIKGKPVYKEQNRFTSIFHTEKMQQDVKKIMADNMQDFENIVLGAVIEDIDYELNAKVYEVSKTGSAKNAIILTDDAGNIYIGYYNGENFTYYTNREDYKEAVPLRIKAYAETKGYALNKE